MNSVAYPDSYLDNKWKQSLQLSKTSNWWFARLKMPQEIIPHHQNVTGSIHVKYFITAGANSWAAPIYVVPCCYFSIRRMWIRCISLKKSNAQAHVANWIVLVDSCQHIIWMAEGKIQNFLGRNPKCSPSDWT